MHADNMSDVSCEFIQSHFKLSLYCVFGFIKANKSLLLPLIAVTPCALHAVDWDLNPSYEASIPSF